ncbi:MAG: glycosyltransferase [Panacibacter sp.]
MSSPFISLCLPTYKNVRYLERLLQSIAAQTFKDYEIIITDNSPDNSVEELAKSYKDQLPIQFYKNVPATGMAENFNRVMQKASGKWIKMMHDDDWFVTPDSLEKFADAARNTRHKFIFSACKNIYASSGKEENDFLIHWKKMLLEDSQLNLFYLNVIGHPSTTMHFKDDDVLYDTQFKWVVDIDFYIKYLTKHAGFEYIPEALINIGIDELQMSGKYYKNPHVEIPEYFTLLAKFPPDLLLKHQYVFHCVWNQLKKFKISNINMIRDYGYSGALPNKIESIINFQKNIPHIILKQTPWSKALMKICFKKITAS